MKLSSDTPMRDRPAIRTLLKTPGPKTEAEVIEIIRNAWIAGWEEGKKTAFDKGFKGGVEVERAWWLSLGFSDAGRTTSFKKAYSYLTGVPKLAE